MTNALNLIAPAPDIYLIWFYTYNPLQGYKIVNQNPDKQVANLEEAVKISGIKPVQPSEIPKRILANIDLIVNLIGDR